MDIPSVIAENLKSDNDTFFGVAETVILMYLAA